MNIIAIISAIFLSLFHNGEYHIHLAISTVLLLGIILISLFQRNKTTFFPPKTGLSIALLLYFLYLFSATIWSISPAITSTAIWWHAGVVFAFFAALQLRAKNWPSLLVVMHIGAVLLLSFTFIQVYITGEPPTATLYNRNNTAALLTLLLLPVPAWFISKTSEHSRLITSYLLLVMAAHAHILGLIGSRGAILALMVGLLFVVWIAFRSKVVAIPKVMYTLSAYLIGFAITNIQSSGYIAHRVASLTSPIEAGQSRYIIWEKSFQMLVDGPWYGIGAGTYHLLYRQYRDTHDSSYGAYAHNDYLQFAIENGIAGIIFIFVLIVAISSMWHKFKKNNNNPLPIGTGLLAGIIATAIHSLFTFNFYILPILLIFGIYLAYLHQHAYPDARPLFMGIPGCGPGVSRFVLTGLLLAMISIPVSSVFAEHYKERAIQAAASQELQLSQILLNRAERLAPMDRSLKTLRVSIYTEALKLPDLSDAQREKLFQLAKQKIDDAVKLSPLDAENQFYLARLYEVYPEDHDKVLHAYSRAMALDPSNHMFRLAMVKRLMDRELWGRAHEILQQGMHYHFHPDPTTKPYYGKYSDEISTHLLKMGLGEITT